MNTPLSKEQFLKIKSEQDNKYSPILWARNIFKDPDKYIILDTETTGLGNAEIVEIAIINLRSEILLNTLLKPFIIIPDNVIDIHGIDNEIVENAPTFTQIYQELRVVLEDKIAIIYNADFDVNILKYSCRLNGLDCLHIQSDCLMLQYSQYQGTWSSYFGNWKWQKLPYGNHRALGDCQSSLRLLFQIAGTYNPLLDSFEKIYQQYLCDFERKNRPQELDDEFDNIPF